MIRMKESTLSHLCEWERKGLLQGRMDRWISFICDPWMEFIGRRSVPGDSLAQTHMPSCCKAVQPVSPSVLIPDDFLHATLVLRNATSNLVAFLLVKGGWSASGDKGLVLVERSSLYSVRIIEFIDSWDVGIERGICDLILVQSFPFF